MDTEKSKLENDEAVINDNVDDVDATYSVEDNRGNGEEHEKVTSLKVKADSSSCLSLIFWSIILFIKSLRFSCVLSFMLLDAASIPSTSITTDASFDFGNGPG